MKKSSVILGLVASLFLAPSAEAAKKSGDRSSGSRFSSAKAARSGSARGSRSSTTAASANLTAMEDGSDASGTVSSSKDNITGKGKASAPSATSTTKVKVAERKIKAEIFNWSTIATKDLNRGTGEVSGADNYIGLKYKFNSRQNLAVRQQFKFNYPKAGEDMKATANDIYLRYTDSKLIKFANDGTVALRLQGDLPTGESSRNYVKHNGVFTARLLASKPVNKTFSFDYAVQGKVYNQSLSNYIDAAGKEQITKRFAASTFAVANADLGGNFGAYQLVGFQNSISNARTDGTYGHDRLVFTEGGFTFGGIPNVNLFIGIQQAASVANGSSFRPFDERQETEYVFSLDASI